jgi:hypothetical protein
MPHPHPLEIIDEKLARAEEHIKELQVQTDALLGAAPYTTITDDDPKELEEFQTMLAKIHVPPRISIVAGEAINQCRSALDHVAAALVLANKGTVTNQTQFPIFVYRPSCEKESLRYEGCVRGMTSSAKALIDQEQPFEAKHRDDHPLTILKRFNNRDKHQAILVTVAAVRPLVLFDIENTRVSHTPDDLADFTLPANLDMNVQRGFAAYVVFAEFGSSKNQPVVESVAKLWACVTFNITRKFRVELTKFP